MHRIKTDERRWIENGHVYFTMFSLLFPGFYFIGALFFDIVSPVVLLLVRVLLIYTDLTPASVLFSTTLRGEEFRNSERCKLHVPIMTLSAYALKIKPCMVVSKPLEGEESIARELFQVLQTITAYDENFQTRSYEGIYQISHRCGLNPVQTYD